MGCPCMELAGHCGKIARRWVSCATAPAAGLALGVFLWRWFIFLRCAGLSVCVDCCHFCAVTSRRFRPHMDDPRAAQSGSLPSGTRSQIALADQGGYYCNKRCVHDAHPVAPSTPVICRPRMRPWLIHLLVSIIAPICGAAGALPPCKSSIESEHAHAILKSCQAASLPLGPEIAGRIPLRKVWHHIRGNGLI